MGISSNYATEEMLKKASLWSLTLLAVGLFSVHFLEQSDEGSFCTVL